MVQLSERQNKLEKRWSDMSLIFILFTLFILYGFFVLLIIEVKTPNKNMCNYKIKMSLALVMANVVSFSPTVSLSKIHYHNCTITV